MYMYMTCVGAARVRLSSSEFSLSHGVPSSRAGGCAHEDAILIRLSISLSARLCIVSFHLFLPTSLNLIVANPSGVVIQ